MDHDPKRNDLVKSLKVRAGRRRTYFLDIRRTKGDDFYITMTESTRRFHGDGYERHKIFLYKEDFNRFLGGLEEIVDYIKTELMPEYDFDEFDRRQAEYEARKAEEDRLDQEYREKHGDSDNEEDRDHQQGRDGENDDDRIDW